MSGQDYEQLSLFPGDSPVSHSVWPGSAEARMMTVTSGQKCLELSMSSGPLGLLEKTLLESSIWRSTRCYLTWKTKDTKQGRLLFRLAVSMPRTGGTDAPLWLGTMTASQTGGNHSLRSPERRKGRTPSPAEFVMMWPTATASDWKCRGPNSHQQGLPEAVRMWPTPTARDFKGANSITHLTRDGKRNHTDQLANAVKLWPTPTSRCGTGASQAETRQGGPDLQTAVQMYPTPTTGAGLCGGTGNYQQLKALEASGQITEEERRSVASGSGGQLNPTWVEWLMGFPLGWTDLSASEMP